MSISLKIFENITPMTIIYQVAYSIESDPVGIFQTKEEAERFLAKQ